MLQLPFGCYCSPLKVNPQNWQSNRASLRKDWFIYYRFYDPRFRENPKYKKGKLVLLKGMNGYRSLGERRSETELIINKEVERLKAGFNPITGKEFTGTTPFQDINSNTPFIQALGQVKPHIKGSSSTHRDIKSILGFVSDAATQLRLNDLPISAIKRKHLKAILNQIEQERGQSAHRYNKIRSYLMILFTELIELEVLDSNPVKDLSKQRSLQKVRTLLTPEKRISINSYLKENHYRLWLFTHIFFHSGARLTELIQIRRSQINLEKGYFIVTIKKGKQYKEVIKPIKNIALSYWTEAVAGSTENDYIFSKGLLPGPVPIQSYQITRRWNRHIKKKIGIGEDFYSLKHLNLDETSALLGLSAAAAMASHTTTAITGKYYAIHEEDRQKERLKMINNTFA